MSAIRCSSSSLVSSVSVCSHSDVQGAARVLLLGFMKQCKPAGVTLDAVEEGEWRVQCSGVTGKELRWFAVRAELKYLRDLGVWLD